ncbi:MAG: hypothetical protein RIQ84_1215 [Pseudomonadota bacterium]|jgi:predicted small lipoprotein YifL
MRFIVSRTWILCAAISLLGCGIRGPLTHPNVPNIPNPPEKAEPMEKQWPPAKEVK